MSKQARADVRRVAERLHLAGMSVAASDNFMATDKAGFVYIVTHPSWPGYVKIGRACDPAARLNQYQTGCPLRDYELHASIYFEDCSLAEKEIHARLALVRAQGEWFNLSVEVATTHIRLLREIL